MDIGLARGASTYRNPVPAQSSVTSAAIQARAAGDVRALSEGDRAGAAQHKALDIQEARQSVDHRGSGHREGYQGIPGRGPGQIAAPPPGPGERPHEGHTHGPDDPHGRVPGQGEGRHAGPAPGDDAHGRHGEGKPLPGIKAEDTY